jgi:hypothetical protein
MSNALAVREAANAPAFVILDQVDTEQAVELVRSAVSSGISTFDFDRIKVPAGGVTSWTVKTLEGEEVRKELDGIIVGVAYKKAFWQTSFEESGGGTPPDCSSQDGVIGEGTPGGVCKRCPFNQFGSAKEGAGAGKACRDIGHLLLLPADSALPVLVTVPPSSLKSVRSYFLQLSGKLMPFYGAISKLSLERDKNAQGIAYSKIIPSFAARLDKEATAKMRAYAEELVPLLASLSVDREDLEPAQIVER